MIRFKQATTGTPPDIVVTTDDSDAELAAMNDAFLAAGVTEDDFDAYKNLNAARVADDGQATFVIPGDEAGDVADVFSEADVPDLNEYLDSLRAKAIARAEEEEAAAGRGAE